MHESDSFGQYRWFVRHKQLPQNSEAARVFGIHSPMDAVGEMIRDNAPEIIGISIRNIDNVNLLNEKRYSEVVGSIVRRIRQETDVSVVLGGSGFSIMPEVILREAGADYGIVGEGESLMVEFWLGSDPGVPLAEACRIPGMAVPRDGVLVPSDAPGFGMEIREEWIN